MVRAADDPRWDEDPSPSWDDCARRAGCGIPVDLPDDPGGGILEVTGKLWPEVHPALQEERPWRR